MSNRIENARRRKKREAAEVIRALEKDLGFKMPSPELYDPDGPAMANLALANAASYFKALEEAADSK